MCIKKVETGNIIMNYYQFGNGKKAFVMLPGLALKSVLLLTKQIEEAYSMFKDDYTVYVFDRRENITDSYSIYNMAEDTALVMKKLGLKDICIFGVSQGGMLGQIIAINHPELVSKLFLGSSASRINNPEVLDNWVYLAREHKKDELVENMLEHIYSQDTLNAYKNIFVDSFKDVSKQELDRFAILAGTMQGYDIYDQLDKIKCEVKVVGAYGDKALGYQASLEIKDKLNCEYYMYPENCGHAVYDEAPDYKDRIKEFFDK